MSRVPAWIELDGAVNVRDVAGLPTSDGRRVRPGRLIRADNLQDLSPADVRRLVDELGVRTVIDLRTHVEVDSEGPGPILTEPSVAWRHLSLIPEEPTAAGATAAAGGSVVLPWHGTAAEIDADRARRGAGAVYLRYLDDRATHVIEALRLIAHEPGASLVHCAAGKDRTGTVVALALESVGVDRAAVVADYVASATRIEQILARLVASPTYAGEGISLDPGDIDRQRPRADTMAAFLDVLDAEHGGAAGWLAAHGWTDEDAAALEAALLA